MQKTIRFENILFLDIETVPQTYQVGEMDDATKMLFAKKSRLDPTDILFEDALQQAHADRGGIWAEFGKIVCISVGFISERNGYKQLHVKAFKHDDEETLLKQFKSLLDDRYNLPSAVLCAHNGKEFDFPYLCRRFLINGLDLPLVLQISGKKPWEIQHIDTMEMWKFGDYKAYTSLELLCHVFNIPTSKDDISGADVARVYYEEQPDGLERIAHYCNKDVVALAQLYLKLNGQPLVDEGEIFFK